MKDQRGFTLLELLIAITLLAALTAILAAGFNLSLRSWEAGQARMEGHYDMDEGLTLIAGQLRGARTVSYFDEKNVSRLAFEGDEKGFFFVAGAPRLKPLMDADGFYLNRLLFDEEGKTLRFAEAPFDPRTAPDDVKWTETRLGEGTVREVKFEYLYRVQNGAEIKDEWKEKVEEQTPAALPLAVRLTVTSGDEADTFIRPAMEVWIEPGAVLAPETRK